MDRPEAEQHICHPNDKLLVAPRVALTWLTPPGRKRSKGNWALVGARGVLFVHRRDFWSWDSPTAAKATGSEFAAAPRKVASIRGTPQNLKKALFTMNSKHEYPQQFDLGSRRDFLLACATWQDSLLQSYRSLSLTVSSILIAVGVGSVVAAIEQSSISYSYGFSFFVLLLATFSLVFSERFQDVILSRGRDVDYWHREIIKLEGYLEEEQRAFTQFKLAQKGLRSRNHTASPPENTGTLSDEQITSVIGSGLGHTRRFIDRSLVLGIRLLWIVISLGALGNIFLRTI